MHLCLLYKYQCFDQSVKILGAFLNKFDGY